MHNSKNGAVSLQSHWCQGNFLLVGRATVELVIERKGDAGAYVTRSGGGPVPQARIGITLDGYSAPLTAGNFAANVQDGVYDGKPLNASYASVLAGRGAIPGVPG